MTEEGGSVSQPQQTSNAILPVADVVVVVAPNAGLKENAISYDYKKHRRFYTNEATNSKSGTLHRNLILTDRFAQLRN